MARVLATPGTGTYASIVSASGSWDSRVGCGSDGQTTSEGGGVCLVLCCSRGSSLFWKLQPGRLRFRRRFPNASPLESSVYDIARLQTRRSGTKSCHARLVIHIQQACSQSNVVRPMHVPCRAGIIASDWAFSFSSNLSLSQFYRRPQVRLLSLKGWGGRRMCAGCAKAC